MGKAFAIAELIIVAAIIGILAALVMPYLHNHTTEAKEAAALDNLRLLRGAIEIYAARHMGVAPGYEGNDPHGELAAEHFRDQTIVQDSCLSQMPENPFNSLDTILMIGNGQEFPTEATGKHGWVYQPAKRIICIDWPGGDRRGVRYFDY